MLNRIGILGCVVVCVSAVGCGGEIEDAGFTELGHEASGEMEDVKGSAKVSICHYSADEDHFHVITVSTNAVSQHFANHGDSYPSTYYADLDGDGFGDGAGATDVCPNDGFVANADDCNDGDAAVNPAASEVPYDGINNDCDAGTPDDDLDGDGFGVATDCNDGDAAVNPGAAEVPYDGINNDCDAGTPDDDLDGDGFGVASDCDDGDAAVNPASAEVPYDGINNDCDAGTPDDDVDGDGYGVATDCDDLDGTRSPGNAELCDDGIDNNCDGQVDEGCAPACVEILLHCDAGSDVLETVCGAGFHSVDFNTTVNASYIRFVGPVAGATLIPCNALPPLTVYGDTDFCSLTGGCCTTGSRYNDELCGVELF